MSKPKVSIITICFNAGKTISQTIESVLAQDYGQVEYIVVDGASTDNTRQILEGFGSRITHLVSEPDKGLYDALNKGLALATGEIIGILHSDDFYAADNVISQVIHLFGQDPKAEAVCASVQIFKGEQFIHPFRTYKANNFRLWQFRFGIQPPHPGFFITRQAFQKTGNYDTSFRISGDFDWLLRVLRIYKAKTIYSDLVVVKMRDGGLSSSGFASKRPMNSEDLRSLRKHGIYSNLFFIYCKYLLKIFQIDLKSFFKK